MKVLTITLEYEYVGPTKDVNFYQFMDSKGFLMK